MVDGRRLNGRPGTRQWSLDVGYFTESVDKCVGRGRVSPSSPVSMRDGQVLPEFWAHGFLTFMARKSRCLDDTGRPGRADQGSFLWITL